MPAVADGSGVLQIGAEWQRQQNEVQVAILGKWGKGDRKAKESPPFFSIKESPYMYRKKFGDSL